MKTMLLALGLAALAACDTVGFGTAIELGNGGTQVSNTISGTSGNVTGGVRIGL